MKSIDIKKEQQVITQIKFYGSVTLGNSFSFITFLSQDKQPNLIRVHLLFNKHRRQPPTQDDIRALKVRINVEFFDTNSVKSHIYIILLYFILK